MFDILYQFGAISHFSQIADIMILIMVAATASAVSMVLLRRLIPAYFGFIDDKAVFVVTLLSIIGSVVGAAISSNLYLGLGMLGALSIIRFRTPIRSAAEISIIFLAVTAGISVNASIAYPLVILLGSIALSLVWRVIVKNSTFLDCKFYISTSINLTELRQFLDLKSLQVSITYIGSHSDSNQQSNFIIYGALNDVEKCIDYLSDADLLRDSTRIE